MYNYNYMHILYYVIKLDRSTSDVILTCSDWSKFLDY